MDSSDHKVSKTEPVLLFYANSPLSYTSPDSTFYKGETLLTAIRDWNMVVCHCKTSSLL